MGDSLKRRSRWLFAEDLEDALRSVREVRYRRAVVLLGTHHGVDTAVALVEAPAGAWAEDAVRALRVRADGVRIIVGTCPPGTIRRTTSGKVRRRTMWDAWVAGTSGVTVVAVAEAR
jgi:acyl-CoA synthetase (AMP-forming)/AMP-acid ligase II